MFLRLCLCLSALSVPCICLTSCFRVTVSAVLSLVGPAHKLFLALPACKRDMFEQINFDFDFNLNSRWQTAAILKM